MASGAGLLHTILIFRNAAQRVGHSPLADRHGVLPPFSHHHFGGETVPVTMRIAGRRTQEYDTPVAGCHRISTPSRQNVRHSAGPLPLASSWGWKAPPGRAGCVLHGPQGTLISRFRGLRHELT